MSNESESNLDLVTPDAPLRTDGPTLAEFVAAGYLPENYPPQGYAAVEPAIVGVDFSAGPDETVVSVVDPHADSGYRPVGGAEIQRYLNAKGMGLTGRPSKAEVDTFLLSKLGK